MKNGEKPIANPYVMLREEFDDWAILFNPDTGRGFGLNPVGVYLWKLLDGGHSIDDMLEALRRDALDVPQEAGDHMVAFVEELARHCLAGYEAESVHDARGRTPPCPTCAGTTAFNYEAPELINLSGEQARGACCSPGTSASAEQPGCCGGDCVTYSGNCMDGACAGNNCSCGGGPGSLHGCKSGSCPDTFFCTTVGGFVSYCTSGTGF